MRIIVDEIGRIYSGILSPNKLSSPMTSRKHHTLAVVTKGSLKNTVGEESVIVKKAEILYIAPNVIDVSVSNKVCTYISVEFSTLNDCDMARLFDSRVYNTGEDTYKDFESILNIWNSDKIEKDIKCFELLYKILSGMVECAQKNSRMTVQYNKLSKAITYINEHCFEQDFRISKLAEHCKLSLVHLNRLFVDLYGKTTREYVSKKRIEYAKILLMDTQYNISDVAFLCGWSDVYTFSHAFKRMTEFSPTDWRKQM